MVLPLVCALVALGVLLGWNRGLGGLIETIANYRFHNYWKLFLDKEKECAIMGV